MGVMARGLILALMVSAATAADRSSNASSEVLCSKTYITDMVDDVSSSLCAEAKQISTLYHDLDAHCGPHLEKLMSHFSYKAHLLAVDHMAQLLARNAVVAATAKRSVQIGFKSPGLPFTPTQSVISVEFNKLEQQLQQATYRLLNARQASQGTMASFDDDTLHRVAAFSRNCADGCTRIMFHSEKISSVFAKTSLNNGGLVDGEAKVNEVKHYLNAEDILCGSVPLSGTLDGFKEQVEKTRAKYMEPIKVLMMLWEDSNKRYATDRDADAAVLDWAKEAPTEKATSGTWKMDAARANVVQSNAMNQLSSAQADLKSSLPQHWPEALALKMQTASSDVVADVAKIEEKIAASTANIAAKYADYASATAVQYVAALQTAAPDAAVKATEEQHRAMMAVTAEVEGRRSVVEEAARIGGRWPAPREQWNPKGLASFSVSNARAEATAPTSAFGDFTLALQHTAGIADEAAIEGSAGHRAARELEEMNLAEARLQLHKEVVHMRGTTLPRPDLASVQEAGQKMQRAMAKEVKMNTAYDKGVAGQLKELPKKREHLLTETERKKVLQEDFSYLVATQELASDKNKLLLHQRKVYEAQTRFENLKSRFNGTLPEV